MKLQIQILLAFLVVIKLVLGSIFMYHTGWSPSLLETDAIAAEIETNSETAPKEDKVIPPQAKIDLNFLAQKSAELEAKEKMLIQKKAALMAIQKDLNTKIATLTQLRSEIRAEVARKKTVDQQKLKHLIKAFSAMKPQSAASLIEKLDPHLVVELLSKMKGDAVGKILSFVKVEKAAQISEGLARQK